MSLSKEEIDDGAEVALAIHASGRDAVHAKFIRLLDALKHDRAQLAELAAREVQLREAMGDAEDFVCVIESLAMDGDRGRISEVAGNAQSRVHRALAAPPSTAAAELVALRDMENAVQAFVKNATVDTWEMGWATLKAHVAAVAAARAGTP